MYIIRYLQSGFPLHFSPSSLVALLLDSEGPGRRIEPDAKPSPLRYHARPAPLAMIDAASFSLALRADEALDAKLSHRDRAITRVMPSDRSNIIQYTFPLFGLFSISVLPGHTTKTAALYFVFVTFSMLGRTTRVKGSRFSQTTQHSLAELSHMYAYSCNCFSEFSLDLQWGGQPCYVRYCTTTWDFDSWATSAPGPRGST